MEEKNKRIKRTEKELTDSKKAAEEISKILDEEIIASRNIPKRTTKYSSSKTPEKPVTNSSKTK